MRDILERFRDRVVYVEGLSEKEEDKRKKARIGIPDSEDMALSANKELMKLGKGIVEDEKKRRGCSGSGWHGLDGEFVNPEDEPGSFSLPQSCPDGGQSMRKSANRSRQSVRRPCGRKGRFRCKDSSAKWGPKESLVKANKSKSVVTLQAIRDIIRQELEAVLKVRAKARGCSLRDALKLVDAVSRAESGKLYAK